MGEGALYAELHCHSNFSFLDGASHPDELVKEADRLGLAALALTDHDGMYGAVRFARAARATGLPTVFGAEVTLGLSRAQVGVADPEGTHLVVLARDPRGYARLCKVLSIAHLLGREKARPTLDLALLAAIGGGADLDLSTISMSAGAGTLPGEVAGERREQGTPHWLVLTGCRKGPLSSALMTAGPGAARQQLLALQHYFGRANVAVEIWDHGEPLASARNDALAEVACGTGADVVATNNVHYHRPSRAHLASAMAAVRGRRSLDDMDGWLPAAASAHLRSGAEQARHFARYPGAVERAGELGLACAFDLKLVAPNLPPFPVPAGHSEMSWLAHLAQEGAERRYGPRPCPSHPRAWEQVDYELSVIDQLGFAGYFLIVWDIVRFCNENNIYCQGRGSAANSAVCYALGVTKADAVRLGLLFERFLSPERDGPPDIDVDIESERREEAIQYVYQRYGRQQAAQVANVITYRPRSAVRDMGKALGASQGQVDAWSKQLGGWSPLPPPAPAPPSPSPTVTRTPTARPARAAGPWAHPRDQGAVDPSAVTSGPGIPETVLTLAREIEDFPRHLGVHSGGMVLCDRPVSEVCPVEWARMADRSVLQWDKDDCAAAGLVKFDMLGLGMLSALHVTVDHIKAYYGLDIDLADLPQDPAVYDMLCQADSVGIFQVESRAQMATLPRLRPHNFYDLVIEVALIRPGPIQGRSVHPYLRRRKRPQEATYLHPLLEKSLARTLGVPLFQEQLMQIAIDVAGFTPNEADQLRQAMGSKRSAQRMAQLRGRFYTGMAERGATGAVADRIWEQMAAFANFGFPESHSVSFAYLVYSSAWLKLHYPAAFLAGLLDCQPMGFWSPQSLVLDARRHGVEVRRPDVNASSDLSLLEPVPSSGPGCPAVRLGISYVRNVGADLATRIAEGRPYRDMEDFARRSGVNVPQAEALATAGAFECFGMSRRQALWAAGALAGSGHGLAGMATGAVAPPLPDMDLTELNRADLWATSLSPDSYPTELVRPELDKLGVTPADQLATLTDGAVVTIGGLVTHRQHPTTASSVIFVNLEDETGLVNVICPIAVWERHKTVALTAPALLVKGKLEKADGALNVLALNLGPLPPLAGAGAKAPAMALRSRDFR